MRLTTVRRMDAKKYSPLLSFCFAKGKPEVSFCLFAERQSRWITTMNVKSNIIPTKHIWLWNIAGAGVCSAGTFLTLLSTSSVAEPSVCIAGCNLGAKFSWKLLDMGLALVVFPSFAGVTCLLCWTALRGGMVCSSEPKSISWTPRAGDGQRLRLD